mgnify:CR=1 FL=1
MKKNGKEFEELRNQFEADLPTIPVYVGANPEREPRDSSFYYSNGKINDLFHAYMAGYQSAKALARLDALPLDES